MREEPVIWSLGDAAAAAGVEFDYQMLEVSWLLDYESLGSLILVTMRAKRELDVIVVIAEVQNRALT
jgi:hypothetical protein